MVLFLASCTALKPTWIEAPACDAEPYAWSDDLLSWIGEGAGDGSFSTDPPGDPATLIEGNYNPYSGSFSWERFYGEEYYLTVDVVQDGFGTAWHNGDLDIEYVTTTTDRLDERMRVARRIQREGCDQQWWVWDPDADSLTYTRFSGTFSGEALSWAADIADVEWSGRQAPDGSTVEDHVAAGLAEHIERGADGTAERSFVQEGTDYTYDGTESRAWNGDRSQAYDILQNDKVVCSVQAEFDYSGDGQAHYDCGSTDVDCAYVVDADGACAYTCTDGQKGDC
ncbi:MAG: hypothetical protein EXR71_05105 [Myxococcales bacterium]|nr:hypothetical protein [Myxococcales bacterium]